MRHWFRFLAASLALSGVARADDGRIEINQARALAGAIAPGDTANFPITIDAAGSYVLTGDLTVPANTTGIQITASDVSLDLNGFAVRGGGGIFGSGIEISGAFAQVHDGLVTGAALDGVRVLAEDAHLENLTLRSNVVGIELLEDRGEIVHCRAMQNASTGIQVQGALDGAIERSFIANNAGPGATLAAGSSARFERNVVRGNGGGTVTGAFSFIAPNYCNGAAVCP